MYKVSGKYENHHHHIFKVTIGLLQNVFCDTLTTSQLLI